MFLAVKASHTCSTHNIVLESLISLERFGIMTDTQAIGVTFDFKGTRVRCVVSESTDYQMNFV